MKNKKSTVEYLKQKGSLQRKFGLKVFNGGVFTVPKMLLFMKKLDLNYSDFYFISLVLSRKYDIEWPYFSLNKITKTLGICQDTLHNAKKRLIKRGYLATAMRKENKYGKGRNVYDLSGLFCAIEKLMIEDTDIQELIKITQWGEKRLSEFAFSNDIEKEAFSEMQRDEEGQNGE